MLVLFYAVAAVAKRNLQHDDSYYTFDYNYLSSRCYDFEKLILFHKREKYV